MKTLQTLTLTALLVSTFIGTATAAHLTIDQITAVPYSEFVTLNASGSQPSGAVEKYVPPAGSALWLVTFRMLPEWDETTDQMNFDSEAFGLFDGDTKLEHVGGMQEFGVMERHWSGAYLYRPSDWKTEKPEGQLRRLWVIIPKGKTEVQLRLVRLIYNPNDSNAEPQKTPYSAAVKLAGEPKPFDMNDFVEVRVRAVKMLESVEDKNEYDDSARPRMLVNQGGSIMQLTVQITPKKANSLEENVFRWSAGVIGLSFGKGGRAVCMGARRNGEINADYGEDIEPADGDIWDSKTVSLYFPVPSNLKTFDVSYFGHKVSSGTVP